MIDHFIIERTNDIALEFDGELLSAVSSRAMAGPDTRRWTEHRIYRVPKERVEAVVTTAIKVPTYVYVVETVGRSIVNGEIDRCNCTVVEQPKDIPAALRAPRTYLTLLAREALDQANLSDPDVPLTDRI